MIGDVDLSDKANVVASPNLVKLAKNNGFYVAAQDGKGDINVKLSYSGKGYAAHNADRIRGGQYLLSGQDNTGIYDADYQDPFFTCKNVTVEKMYETPTKYAWSSSRSIKRAGRRKYICL